MGVMACMDSKNSLVIVTTPFCIVIIFIQKTLAEATSSLVPCAILRD